jgi:hypothetical protein
MTTTAEAREMLEQILKLYSEKPAEVKEALLKCGFTYTEGPLNNLKSCPQIYIKGTMTLTFG